MWYWRKYCSVGTVAYNARQTHLKIVVFFDVEWYQDLLILPVQTFENKGRARSRTRAPASCSLNTAIICSSLNRLRFILRPPLDQNTGKSRIAPGSNYGGKVSGCAKTHIPYGESSGYFAPLETLSADVVRQRWVDVMSHEFLDGLKDALEGNSSSKQEQNGTILLGMKRIIATFSAHERLACSRSTFT